MCEILFRGKTVKGERWFEGSLLIYPDGEAYICVDTSDPNALDKYHVIPETVGRYTGLKDGSGRRIFEGDILRNHGNPVDLTLVKFGEFGVIDMEAESVVDNAIGWHTKVIPTDALSQCEPFCYDMPLSDYWLKRCEAEVIGNIHDNPELLEGGAAE